MAHHQPEGARDRVSNPNYHSPPPPYSSAQYAPVPPPPSVSQPAPRQPHFDPFRGRDPFLPASSSSVEKRDGRSSDNTQHDVLQHGPAPPQSSFHHASGSIAGFRSDHSRPSSSIHGAAYEHSGQPVAPPPPPPPPPSTSSAAPPAASSTLHGRQMLPPTSAGSPVGNSSRSHSRPRSPPAPNSFGNGRDSVAASTKHRSNSSMSIQSMIGPERAPVGLPQHSDAPSNGWSSYNQNSTNSSGYSRQHSPSRDGHGSRGPRTPERRYEALGSQRYPQPPASQYSARSPTHYSSVQAQSPISSTASMSHLNQPVQFMPNAHSGMPARPFSQPAVANTVHRPEEHERSAFGPISTSRPGDDRNRPSSQRQANSISHDRNSRDRALSDQDARRDAYSRESYMNQAHPHHQTGERQFAPIRHPNRSESSEPRYAQIWKDRPPQQHQEQHQRHAEIRPDNSYSRREDLTAVGTTREEPSMPKDQPTSFSQPLFDSSRFPASSSQPPEPHATGNGMIDFSTAAPANGGAAEHTLSVTPNRFNSSQPRTLSVDPQLRKSIEDNQAQHRAILGIGNDFSRRTDRGSPLPQAVQGASAQPAGSGRNPSIKSEFGRMFSGLGSGIGSTPQPLTSQPLGHPPPGRQSPLVPEDMDQESFQKKPHDGEIIRGSGTSSRGGRRGKRTFDEDGRVDSVSHDGRTTPVGAFGRAGKKSKTTHPGVLHHHHHHHHHHPLGHHHHHYHRKPDEETVAPFMTRGGSGTPLNALRFPSNSQVNGQVVSHNILPHHHHHPAGSYPHHHHFKPQPMRRPITTIKTNALLESVAHLPRKHLGSHLYAPTVATPPSHTFSLGSTHMFSTKPNLLPRFDQEQHSNCTITVRVPRYYLTHHSREAICADRRLWGTDVYTDDSDPVAAAIHSGWMRGAWNEDVDVSLLLGLEVNNQDSDQGGEANSDEVAGVTSSSIKEAATPAEDIEKNRRAVTQAEKSDNQILSAASEAVANRKSMTEARGVQAAREIDIPPPTGPEEPPQDIDLHITLLILPPLEKYASSVWHGVKSRSWNENHDGLSYKILKLEYVDEGPDSRYEPRHHLVSGHNKKQLKPAVEPQAGRPFGNTARAVGTIGTRFQRKKVRGFGLGTKGRSQVRTSGPRLARVAA